MPPDADGYDLFVSYAREDNRDGWISRFVERLLAEHRRVTGGRPPLKPFFDTSDIRSLDDWRLRIHDSLAQSRLLLAFVSPTYLTRPWCRREWRTWIDHEIAQHILSSGVAPIHIVEVPGLTSESDERQVARAVAALCRLAPPHEPFVEEGRQGLGPDAWREYAQHLNTRADRFLYCLANRFIQSPPRKDEAFQLAEVFDELGHPFDASALRDRFRDA